MRTDLRDVNGFKIPKGKMIAQGGHAFVGLITNRLIRQPHPYPNGPDILYYFQYGQEHPVSEWINGQFTKIVLAVDSEEELEEIYKNAQACYLNVVRIVDNGLTVFGKPTFTCIGIGPDWEHNIDAITGHLKGFQ